MGDNCRLQKCKMNELCQLAYILVDKIFFNKHVLLLFVLVIKFMPKIYKGATKGTCMGSHEQLETL